MFIIKLQLKGNLKKGGERETDVFLFQRREIDGGG